MSIDRDLEDPVYEQIAGRLRSLISSGGLYVGSSLPTVRRLADDLGVSLNTVARAYRVLESEGFLTLRSRAGVKVAAPAKEPQPATTNPLLSQLRATLERLHQAGMAHDQVLDAAERALQAFDDTAQEHKP